MTVILTTRQLVKETGLAEWKIWRFAKYGRLNPIRLASQFVWTTEEVEKAKVLAAQINKRKMGKSKGLSPEAEVLRSPGTGEDTAGGHCA